MSRIPSDEDTQINPIRFLSATVEGALSFRQGSGNVGVA